MVEAELEPIECVMIEDDVMCGGKFESTTDLEKAQEQAQVYKSKVEAKHKKKFEKFTVFKQSFQSTYPPQWDIYVNTDQGNYVLWVSGFEGEYNYDGSELCEKELIAPKEVIELVIEEDKLLISEPEPMMSKTMEAPTMKKNIMEVAVMEEPIMEERTMMEEPIMCGGKFENTTNLEKAQEQAEVYKSLVETEHKKKFEKFTVVKQAFQSTNPPSWDITVDTNQGTYTIWVSGFEPEYNYDGSCLSK